MFCSTKPSWQGDRCAPPLHPPGHGSVRALNPCRSQETVSPVNHSRETSLSLHPSIPSGRLGAIAPPEPTRIVWPKHHQSGECSCSPRYPHDHFMETNPSRIGYRHFMETTSSRPRRGACVLPFLGTIPSTKGSFTPLGTPTNPARIGCCLSVGAKLAKALVYRVPPATTLRGRLAHSSERSAPSSSTTVSIR